MNLLGINVIQLYLVDINFYTFMILLAILVGLLLKSNDVKVACFLKNPYVICEASGGFSLHLKIDKKFKNVDFRRQTSARLYIYKSSSSCSKGRGSGVFKKSFKLKKTSGVYFL